MPFSHLEFVSDVGSHRALESRKDDQRDIHAGS